MVTLRRGPKMLKQKLTTTAAIVLIVVVAALGADYLSNTVILNTPGQFTPLNTLAIALLVSTPVCYYLVSQRLNLQRTKEALAEAVREGLRQRDEAQGARARAESALERMRENEALYRLLADNQTDVISLWSAEGVRKYTSPSAERTFGYSLDELMRLPRAANAHPDDVPIIQALTASLTPESGGKSAEYRLLHRDGSAVWVEGTFKRLDDGGMISTTRVIAERKRLQLELIRALEEAKSALRVKSEFLANMTHELRTPLNAIVGFSGLLQASETLSAQDSRHAGLIHDASQSLLGIVNDVLDFSKLDADAVEFEARPFDPRVMAQSVVDLMADHAVEKGLGLTAAFTGDDGFLLGDGARLRQVLTNLVSNAIKFTAAGGVNVTVSQSGGDLRRLRVAVEDCGIGVPSDQRESIFDRFTQADASVSRQYGGTGLGLAICKRIVAAMGGSIGVDSRPGQGSTFWFEVSLPVGQAPVALDAPTQVNIARKVRLLVVDDNAINRELITALLEPFDIDIETASDGIEAVEACARTSFDLILMDVQMPNMDGLTAARRIRATATPGAARIPIVAMTANVLPEQISRCRAAGMDDHLAKPIDAAKLLETLAHWTDEDEGAEEGVAEG
jgi:PAS domain S-box-containing protein